jgi:hypothetical protein
MLSSDFRIAQILAERAGADTSIMNNLSNTEANITTQGYDVGRQEFNQAVVDKENSLSTSFNPSTSLASGVNSADETVGEQANANEQESTSWMGLVGGLADSAVNGLTAGLGKPPAPPTMPTGGSPRAAPNPNPDMGTS